MESPQPHPPTHPPTQGRLAGRLAAAGATGLLIGAAVIGFGGMASADEPTLDAGAEAEPAAVVEAGSGSDDGSGDGYDIDAEAFELSPEDEAVFGAL